MAIESRMEEFARVKDAYGISDECECGGYVTVILAPKHCEPYGACDECLKGYPYMVPTVELHRNGEVR